MDQTPNEVTHLIDRLRAGDRQALAELFHRYRERLRRMVELRMDARLRARLDASDVLQEAYLDAGRRSRCLPRRPQAPAAALDAAARRPAADDAAPAAPGHPACGTPGWRSRSIARRLPQASSAALASMLLGRHTSPTQAAQRAERLLRVQEALNTLDPIDREVLALRHFEQLSRAETAEVLGISPEAGAKRYFRALKRLKEVLASMPGGWEGI